MNSFHFLKILLKNKICQSNLDYDFCLHVSVLSRWKDLLHVFELHFASAIRNTSKLLYFSVALTPSLK